MVFQLLRRDARDLVHLGARAVKRKRGGEPDVLAGVGEGVHVREDEVRLRVPPRRRAKLREHHRAVLTPRGAVLDHHQRAVLALLPQRPAELILPAHRAQVAAGVGHAPDRTAHLGGHGGQHIVRRRIVGRFVSHRGRPIAALSDVRKP